MLQENKLRTELESGNVAIGASCGLYSSTVIEVFGERDVDFLFMDFEHNGPSVWDGLTITEFVRAAEHADVELVLRLPSATEGNHAPMIRKVLDTGVNNVVVPRVETPSEVEKIVEATRFRYRNEPGTRGVGAARGSRWGGELGSEWVDDEDASTLCGIMVETTEAVENIEEIVSTPGLGFVFIGSMDLSVALGVPTATDHERFEAAVDTVIEACLDADVPFGQLGAPNATPADLVNRGAQLVRVGSDIGSIRGAFKEDYSDLRE